MKNIPLFDKAYEENESDLSERGINRTLFWAYQNSQFADNDLLDFNESLWESEIEDIVTAMEENDITEFTISSTFSGLINILVEFEKHGFKIKGLTEVNAPYTDIRHGGFERVNAICLIKA